MDNYLAIGEFAVTELLKHHLTQVKEVVIKSEKERSKYQKYGVLIKVNPSSFDRLIKKEDIYAYAIFTPYKMSLDKKRQHILISNLNDEGEMGTILRTLVAFSYFDVAIINSKINLFSNKLIRASTGALFMMNVVKFNSIEDYRKIYSNPYLEFKNKNAPLSLEVGARLYALKR